MLSLLQDVWLLVIGRFRLSCLGIALASVLSPKDAWG